MNFKTRVATGARQSATLQQISWCADTFINASYHRENSPAYSVSNRSLNIRRFLFKTSKTNFVVWGIYTVQAALYRIEISDVKVFLANSTVYEPTSTNSVHIVIYRGRRILSAACSTSESLNCSLTYSRQSAPHYAAKMYIFKLQARLPCNEQKITKRQQSTVLFSYVRLSFDNKSHWFATHNAGDIRQARQRVQHDYQKSRAERQTAIKRDVHHTINVQL